MAEVIFVVVDGREGDVCVDGPYFGWGLVFFLAICGKSGMEELAIALVQETLDDGRFSVDGFGRCWFVLVMQCVGGGVCCVGLKKERRKAQRTLPTSLEELGSRLEAHRSYTDDADQEEFL